MHHHAVTESWVHLQEICSLEGPELPQCRLLGSGELGMAAILKQQSPPTPNGSGWHSPQQGSSAASCTGQAGLGEQTWLLRAQHNGFFKSFCLSAKLFVGPGSRQEPPEPSLQVHIPIPRVPAQQVLHWPAWCPL